jgi:hypothetical protein
MNTITQVVLVLVLWLVTGLGFLTKYAEVRRKGGTLYDAGASYEFLFFILSILVPLVILIHRSL